MISQRAGHVESAPTQVKDVFRVGAIFPARADALSIAAWGSAILAFVLLYWPVLAKLVHDWGNDDNYSHGFLIVPVAAYFAWDQRRRLLEAPLKPSWTGLLFVLLGLMMLVAGLLGAELFLTRTSMLAVLVGGLVFVLGWPAVRVLALPLAFLLLMIPIPAIIFNQIAFPLQLLASRVGEWVMTTLGIPVLREGNVIILANTTLEVAEACSGIRSLMSLLALGITYGYLTDPRTWTRTLIALMTIPIAIVANAIRVAGTGVAAHYIGPEAAEGFFHTFSGWLVFVVAFLLLFLAAKLVVRFVPPPAEADRDLRVVA